MARATQQQMLEQAKQIDSRLVTIQAGKNKVMFGQLEPAIPGEPPAAFGELSTDDDPFGGNINNRKVAERISKQRHRKHVNLARPMHTGDPEKARRDVAKSKAIVPDPIEGEDDSDGFSSHSGATGSYRPQPGSPAAQRAETPVAATTETSTPQTSKPVQPNTVPPTWKNNA